MREIPSRVLVEAMVRADGTVDCGDLYAVAGLLGMTDQQVRLSIKRLVTDGRFVQEGRGRKALLRATAETRRRIEPDVEFVRLMYRQDRGDAPWDGTWHLAGFAIPEPARAARDALRETIVYLGGAPVQGGLYVSPNAWEDLVEAEAARLGVQDHTTLLTSRDLRVGPERDARALARALWPLDEIAERHTRLAGVAAEHLSRLRAGPPERERLTITIELAAEFTQAMEPDPLLPPELLPHPWPGVEARNLVARCWAQLLDNPPQNALRLYETYTEVARSLTT
ncbi:PaaX family transcriptional regulator C-terminal domain-containing protein [Actinomadura chibensis]|uniref:Transcriptional regulator n=1 Tax=Actinomadura chibensis TaxID=392828 RepID=A0A5D0NW28_9ACTN|nr:PaaX family transcriptional regulator C-terminal domain-containing protein [Actinomadura chibensis]TYB48850.1 transcriptional regulator [Actinomadura chibensis]